MRMLSHAFRVFCLCALHFGLSGTSMAAEQAEVNQRFDVWEYLVRGNTVLDEVGIGTILEAFTGPSKTADDVERARSALEAGYRERGFQTVAVTIPAQNARSGTVLLEVVEAKVGHLKVLNSRYHTLEQIKSEIPSLAEGGVPDFSQVQEDLVALNSQADRRVTPALKAGKAPGTIDVDLVVDDDLPLHGSLELNNRRSQDTSTLRTVASLSYDNLWQRGHSLALSYQTAPRNTKDAQVFYASYLAPSGHSPWSLLINGFTSDSDVATVGGINVVGRGETLGLRAIYTLPAEGTLFQSITVGVDYKDFVNRTTLGEDQFDTPVTYYPMNIAYTALLRSKDSALSQFDFSMHFASPQFGSSSHEYGLNSYLARGQQFYLRTGLSRTQPMPWESQAELQINAQWTDQALITNEQLAAGGMDSVRGYFEAEMLGSSGYTARLEWRTPTWSSKPLDGLALFGFVDGAQLWIQDPQPGQPDLYEALSFGAGLEMKFFSNFGGDLVWALPTRDGPASQAWSSRVLFKLTGSF